MGCETEYSIFLHIIEGIGFTEKNDEISLNVTLNGVKFEIEGHNTECATIFNSNCIWECMFDDLKRMKTDNRPIKIECFHKAQKHDKEIKKAIGFVLLPIRSLQTIKTLRNLQIKLHWYKLCGLAAEWRSAKPEIYLSAIITTKDLMETGQLEEFLEPKPLDSSESIYIRPSKTVLMLKSQQGIHVELLDDEGLLQVGNGPNDCDTFVVTLSLKEAKHLDEHFGSTDSGDSVFRFHYDFLGGLSDLILDPTGDGVYSIHEKISVNFRSSLESLRDYFWRVFYIPIELYYKDNIIGNYKFTCAGLLPSSLDVFNNDNTWEVKDSFTLQTLFDNFVSSDRPTVDYVFNLSFIPTLNSGISQLDTPDCFDKGARGDMGDKNSVIELPPTPVKAKTEEEHEVQSAKHKTYRETESNLMVSQSDPQVSFKPEEEVLQNDIAYKVVTELEDWKCQQMDNFLVELKRKEVTHLNKLSAEWERQKGELSQQLHDKLEDCTRLTKSLEAAQAVVRAKTQKQYEEERAFEKTKHELDKRYTVRFMEIEEKARRIQDEMEYELKRQDLRFKELQMEKDREASENEKMRAKIKQLKEELEEMRRHTLPREQLTGLFKDLRKQSERYTEMEKSKKFYKDQWAKLSKEVHKLKLHALKIQEEKLKQTSCLGIENIKDLRSMIYKERTELLSDRGKLESIKNALTSDSDASKSSSES